MVLASCMAVVAFVLAGCASPAVYYYANWLAVPVGVGREWKRVGL